MGTLGRILASNFPDRKYTPFYCEENIWHLADDGGTVVVITNERRQVPLWEQRLGSPVVWDYHVVLVRDGRVYDMDTELPFPCDLRAYVQSTFRLPDMVKIRRVEAQDYRASFSSDRSHMKDADGAWIHPPPVWPLIMQGKLTLERLLDPTDLEPLRNLR